MLKLLIIFLHLTLLSCLVGIHHAQTTTTSPFSIKPNTDYGLCNCDLTLNICNTNCCCDTLCTKEDKASFKCTLSNTPTTVSQRWCVQSSVIFRQNTPYIINSLGDLLCVDFDSSKSLNYYNPPDIPTADQITKLVSNLVYPANPVIGPLLAELGGSRPFFTAEDYIWLNFNNKYLGFLTLPIQVGSSCRSGPPLKYLSTKKSQCLVSNTKIANECQTATTTSLSLVFFYYNYAFLQNPSNPLGDLVPIKISFCQDDSGNSIPVSQCATYLQPSVSGTKCNNLVQRVVYILRYRNPTGIVEAGLDVTFFSFNLNANAASVSEQKFEVVYIPNDIAINDYKQVYNSELSGNPGYLVGKPVQASGDTYVKDGFSYLKANTDGTCANDDSRRGKIKFGYNVATDCNLNVYNIGSTNSPTYCESLQQKLDSIILGYALDKRAKFYAPFANTQRKDWQEITNPVDASYMASSASTQFGGVCKSIRTGLSIQIAYALVGNVNNPQAEIVAISFNWYKLNDINLRCTSQFCPEVYTALNVKVSTLVTFVDVSLPPLYTESGMSRPKTTLSGDFFYPLSAAQSTRANAVLLAFFVFLLIFKYH